MAGSDTERKEASTEAARRGFGELVDRVRFGERIVITRFGRPVAALVPMADYEALCNRRRRGLARVG